MVYILWRKRHRISCIDYECCSHNPKLGNAFSFDFDECDRITTDYGGDRESSNKPFKQWNIGIKFNLLAW